MTNQCDVQINGDRLWSSLMRLAEIGATAQGGCNRQALSDEDRTARDLFSTWAREIGCEVVADEVGNLFVRRPGRDIDAAPVLMGSHLDTQITGGRFDGVYGVMAGLEVLRTLHDRGIQTRRPLEVASWTNEEGCRFVPAMLGSGVMSGAYELQFALSRKDKAGVSLGDELERIGYRGSLPARPRPYRAMFEAHIEQGPVLENEGKTIGVVAGIQGAYWLDVILEGAACHAGPTPMNMRRDPWRAALPIIQGALDAADWRTPYGRATIGDIRATPGSRNTVPEKLVVAVDLRHPDASTLEGMVADFKTLVDAQARRFDIRGRVEHVWHMPPTAFDAQLVDLVGKSAAACGYSHLKMVSGAGHDSLHTAQFAPTAMIFVPCAGGLSHNEAEDATPADLAAGANVLLQCVLATAND